MQYNEIKFMHIRKFYIFFSDTVMTYGYNFWSLQWPLVTIIEMYQRIIEGFIKEKIGNGKAIVIVGARQVGKPH